MNQDTQDNRLVIVGVGQCVHHAKDMSKVGKVDDLIQSAINRAEEDAGVANLARKIDTLFLVNSFSWPGENPVIELSEKIGAKPRNTAYTWIGASAPQWFVNRMAERIQTGQGRLGLICGGEALHSLKMKTKAAGNNSWSVPMSGKNPDMAGDLRDPLTPLEMKYGLVLPIHIYPLFENALRHHEGLSIEQHLNELAEFGSTFSEIASKNSYAWFGEHKSVDEIREVSASNRLISWPYTKLMCSIIETDQAAALFLTDEQTAEELGVPKEKWIHLRGAGDASDIWHVTERLDFFSSPSVKVAADMALEEAELSFSEIDHLDFYSCFPSAARMTRNMLGMSKSDPRPLTVTGGMPSFGGPGNNYALHAICGMAEVLRRNPGKTGMVQALSWFISKHSVGVYSGEAGPSRRKPIPKLEYQKELDRLQGPIVVDEASGRGTVETFALTHDREGEPVGGIVIGKMDDGNRFLAKTEMDADALKSMMESECIGNRGKIRSKDGFNTFGF